MGVLTVYLDKCTGLKDADVVGKSDPYVTLTCKKSKLGIKSDVGQAKSTVKQNELNPIYGETFFFTIESLDNHSLYMSVKDEDVGKDDSLGYCEINLEGARLTEAPQEFERIVDRNMMKEHGKIYVKLSYKEG